MKNRYLRLLLAVPALGCGLTLAGAPAALALSLADAPQTHLAAQAAVTAPATKPGLLTKLVTDEAGALSTGDVSNIESAIQQVSAEQHKSLRVVYIESFGGVQPATWAQQAADANGPNTAVLVVSPSERAYAVAAGDQWTQKQVDAMDSAAYSHLSQNDWAGAAVAAADAAAKGSAGSGSGSGSGSGGSGAGWVAGGLGVAALAGGGIYAASKRETKKTQAKQLESAKALDPSDTDSLGRLPTPTLEQVARDALVSADESITQGKEELRLATAEFGAERVRPFTSAMNTATSTLQRAFNTHQRLYDAIPETEPERRAMLVDIISSSGQAEKALRDRTSEFNEMRGVLMRAPEEVEKVRARTIDIRARLEPAQRTLNELHQRYSEQMLHSISENVEIASGSLDEAEKHLDQASRIADRGAGQQGGLIDELSAATRAVDISDTNLSAIEHAEENIHTAQSNLSSLRQEIEGELREIEQVKGATRQGAQIDTRALDEVAAAARQVLAGADARADTDPLALYTELTDVDARIDQQLAVAKGVAGDQTRALQLFDQQIRVAATQIQSAEDLIRSRGRIIGSHARTLLAESKRQYAEAQQRRVRDTRSAIEFARAATETARRAAQAANDDIDRYRAAQNRQTANNMAQAVLWGSLLSGGFGGGGGYGGGFSGGGGGFGGPSARGGTF